MWLTLNASCCKIGLSHYPFITTFYKFSLPSKISLYQTLLLWNKIVDGHSVLRQACGKFSLLENLSYSWKLWQWLTHCLLQTQYSTWPSEHKQQDLWLVTWKIIKYSSSLLICYNCFRTAAEFPVPGRSRSPLRDPKVRSFSPKRKLSPDRERRREPDRDRSKGSMGRKRTRYAFVLFHFLKKIRSTAMMMWDIKIFLFNNKFILLI